jgi:hypothetical protein
MKQVSRHERNLGRSINTPAKKSGPYYLSASTLIQWFDIKFDATQGYSLNVTRIPQSDRLATMSLALDSANPDYESEVALISAHLSKAYEAVENNAAKESDIT